MVQKQVAGKKRCVSDMTCQALWDNTGCGFSMESKAGGLPTVPERELYRSVQAMLPRETDIHHSPDCLNKGMLRWTLHKKVRNNPANGLSLLWVLIKELEKAERWASHEYIIPLLHTLMYTIIQTAYIPDELYKRVYNFCKRLLTYPQPYCTVGLSYARRLKTERVVPGLLYQRMVVAEQRLKNEHYPYQDRIFVLADPKVFSDSLAQVVLADIEAASASSPIDHMRRVVQHSIQANLGERYNGYKLAETLKDIDIEPYFQDVMATAERCAEESRGRVGNAPKSQLQKLCSNVITSVNSETASAGPFDCPLPNPEMSFHLWTEELDIWREVAKWLRSSSSQEQFSLTPEHEDPELGDLPSDLMPPDKARFSVMSNDSGIERDLSLAGDASPLASIDSGCGTASWDPCKSMHSEQDSVRLSRRGGMKVKPSVKDSVALLQDTLEGHTGGLGYSRGGGREATLQRGAGSNATQTPISKQQRLFTARIVVMGGDSILGHLAKAYYCLRKREARRIFLTMKVNLQFYYIPVCTVPTATSSDKENHQSKQSLCTLGSFLSIVDPWYNCNISSLGCMIPKMAQMQQTNSSRPKEPFVSDVISYYVRMGQQPVYFNIYFVKITFSSMTKETVEDVFLTHLEVDVPELRNSSAPMREKQKKSVADVCGALVGISYKKVTLSGRDTERGLPMRTTGANISAIPLSAKEDLNCLTLLLKEWPGKAKNNSTDFKIRSNNIKLCLLDSRSSLRVTLDRDCRRTYNDVQSIEIVPCLEPGYCIQKNIMSKLNLGEDEDVGLSKYMTKGLPLPVNTFAGIIN
nr:phosphoinositide 3-kinase regulatory subunit 6-like [Nerophis lumbriciformis]